eukprot:326537_1
MDNRGPGIVDESPEKTSRTVSKVRNLSQLSPPASPGQSPADSPERVADGSVDDKMFQFSLDDPTGNSDLNDSRFMPKMDAKRLSAQIAGKKLEITKVKIEVSETDAQTFHDKTAG